MEHKDLQGLIIKKRKGGTRVVSFRLPEELLARLEKKGVDIPKTVKQLLERIAD